MSVEQNTLPLQQQHSRHSWLIPLLCLLSGGALLGLSTNLAKQAGEVGLSPQAFLSWSISGAALLLLIIASLRKALPPVNKRTVRYFIISALLGVAGSNLIFFLSHSPCGRQLCRAQYYAVAVIDLSRRIVIKS